ncbi:hypothetical protein AKJ49_00500 [candidate division MSBL1 archaeon SCGC-AAA382A03]|uniref:Uncharacterized protein n=1 Tax=candidate division MSBL1 archaeon SCGC-AAA382A03 TaxID=1698278 RepID=A0A133VGL6_9EURY|nr:hypothetical protein AKJ49_00500 [candidate division MSBL1 archaeon SCGC-AAA382A03]
MEFLSELLESEKILVSRLRRGELDQKTVGALLSRINTGVVTLVQDALDDRDLAEELVRAFEKAIKNQITVAPPVLSTLGKTLAMRHDLEFNGHRPSEQDLKRNLAGLKITLEQLESEKHLNVSQRDRKKIGRSKENQRDNPMFC